MAEVSAVAREAAMLGAPLDLKPMEALLWVVRLTTGEVAWLTSRINENPADADLLLLLLKVRAEAMDRLANYSALAHHVEAQDRLKP